jgi:hypothetical protein
MEMRSSEEILKSRSALTAGNWSKSKTEIKELEHWRRRIRKYRWI